MRCLAALPLMLAPCPALAAAEDRQAWLTLNTTGSIDGPWIANGELVTRAGERDGRVYEAEITAQIGYEVSDNVTVFAGYTRVANYDGRPGTRIEDRARQQLNWKLGTLGGGALSSRTLLEQRLRSDAPGTSVRLRQRLSWALPLDEGGDVALAVSHESFVVINDTTWEPAGYRRMRHFVGVSLPVVADVKAEFGYVNQYDVEEGAQDQIAHAASLTLSYAF